MNVHWVLQFLLQCLAPGSLSQELTLQVVQLTPGTNRQTDRQTDRHTYLSTIGRFRPITIAIHNGGLQCTKSSPEVLDVGHTARQDVLFSTQLPNLQFEDPDVLQTRHVLALTCSHSSWVDNGGCVDMSECGVCASPLARVDCCILIFSYKRASSSFLRISCVPRMSLSPIT